MAQNWSGPVNIQYRFVDRDGKEYVNDSPKISISVASRPSDFGHVARVGTGLGSSGTVKQLQPIGWRMKGETGWREFEQGDA